MELFSSSPITNTISFGGWIGFSGFVWLSGYGLTLKYSSKVDTKSYILCHYLKLFILLLPAFVCFLVYAMIRYEYHIIDYIYFAIEQALLLNILNPCAIQPGVFWYIGLAFQLYLCFLILRKTSNLQLVLIACICIVLCIFLPSMTEYFRHNAVGWMPEFVFGIYFARHKEIDVNKITRCFFAAGGMAFVAFCALSHYSFMFSGIAFIVFLLAVKNWFCKSQFLSTIGLYSAAIYVVHPIIRLPWPQTRIFSQLHPIFDTMLFLLISILVAFVYNIVYTLLNTRCQQLCQKVN